MLNAAASPSPSDSSSKKQERSIRSVHVLADKAGKIPGLLEKLAPHYSVSSSLLMSGDPRRGRLDAVVIDVDLRVVENIMILREKFPDLAAIGKRVFLVDEGTRLTVVQAF